MLRITGAQEPRVIRVNDEKRHCSRAPTTLVRTGHLLYPTVRLEPTRSARDLAFVMNSPSHILVDESYQLLRALLIRVFPESPCLSGSSDGLPFVVVRQVVPDQFSTFFRRPIGDHFLARVEHLAKILLPVGEE